MSQKRPDYDVFLSYAVKDVQLARRVERELVLAGLKVFNWSDTQLGEDTHAALWHALAESAAIVVVAAKGIESANILAEIGAGMAWQKLIFIISDRMQDFELGLKTRYLRVHDFRDLAKVTVTLKEASRPMSVKERLILLEVYGQLGVHMDAFVRMPSAVDRLTTEFNKAARTNFSGARIMRELLQLRKYGKLPSLGHRRKAQMHNLHVVPKAAIWAVSGPRDPKLRSIHSTQRDAIESAKRMTRAESSEVVTHTRTAAFREAETSSSVPKYTRNTGKPWTAADIRALKQMARENTPTRVIGLKLGRTAAAVSSRASDLGVSLKPTNQSPYNRNK